jgi:hypothetical protein
VIETLKGINPFETDAVRAIITADVRHVSNLE